MAPDQRRSRNAIGTRRALGLLCRLLSIVLGGVALAGGLTTVLGLGSISFWGLLYCTVKPPLECLMSLAVLALWWGAAALGVGLALVGCRRLWRIR